MRIWDLVHPRQLNRFHLLGEHKELHQLALGQWEHHPEAKRFAGDQRPLLVLRHELLRFELMDRWGKKHNMANHPSPVDPGTIDDMERVREEAMKMHLWDNGTFRTMMPLLFPPTELDDVTPWDRDRMTEDDYLALWNDWTREYKLGERPDDDPYEIAVRDVA